jgi:hypothetical protein
MCISYLTWLMEQYELTVENADDKVFLLYKDRVIGVTRLYRNQFIITIGYHAFVIAECDGRIRPWTLNAIEISHDVIWQWIIETIQRPPVGNY